MSWSVGPQPTVDFSFLEEGALLESSRVSVSSNVSAMSHSRHSYSECLSRQCLEVARHKLRH